MSIKAEEQILKKIFDEIEIGEDIVFIAIIEKDGKIEFKAGNADLSKFSIDATHLMKKHQIAKMVVYLNSIKILAAKIINYFIIIASKSEQKLGFILSIIESKTEAEKNRNKPT